MHRIAILAVVLLLTPAIILGTLAPPTASAVDPDQVFGGEFWEHWGDGHAELAGYDLQYSRYGKLRRGTAVTIFVTETFSNPDRVKSDPGNRPASDEFPVMKLNLIEDFPTGLYDYNLMTSAFVGLTGVNGRPPGHVTKVSFSSQEWCGHVWWQALFDEAEVRVAVHSYFDGEADQQIVLPIEAGGVAEDALFFWARGLGAPFVSPGQIAEAPVLLSAQSVRLRHRAPAWERARFARTVRKETIQVPAGTFEADVHTVQIDGGDEWRFWVESGLPHRILRWEKSDGQRAELLASSRLKYWELNGPGGESVLERLGLSARSARTP